MKSQTGRVCTGTYNIVHMEWAHAESDIVIIIIIIIIIVIIIIIIVIIVIIIMICMRGFPLVLLL